MREYPKMLYKDGEAGPGATRHDRTRVVRSASEEILALADGYFSPLGKGALIDAEMRRRFHGADPAKFDHDGKDGPGGAPKGGNRKRRKN